MIVKKLLLGEEIKKKNENDHFDKYIELLIEMDKKNDKEDENYFENLHKNFKKELLNTLEIDGVETEREEKAIKDKIKGILK